MSAVLKIDLEFKSITCANCGVAFAVPRELQERRREDHAGFYCPNGHNNFYPAETEAEKLKKELERERQRTAAAQLQTRMERDLREKAERKLKRVDKGTCPKCNRHFVNVERHMKTKHAH